MILHLFFQNNQQASTKSMGPNLQDLSSHPIHVLFSLLTAFRNVASSLLSHILLQTWHFPGTCDFFVCFFAGLGVLLVCSFLFLLYKVLFLTERLSMNLKRNVWMGLPF